MFCGKKDETKRYSTKGKLAMYVRWYVIHRRNVK